MRDVIGIGACLIFGMGMSIIIGTSLVLTFSTKEHRYTVENQPTAQKEIIETIIASLENNTIWDIQFSDTFRSYAIKTNVNDCDIKLFYNKDLFGIEVDENDIERYGKIPLEQKDKIESLLPEKIKQFHALMDDRRLLEYNEKMDTIIKKMKND